MVRLTLYGMEASPPVRACLLSLKALDLLFDIKQVNLLEKEHLSEEYLKKNPQHTVPTLEDDGHFIWDSHAIMAYLVSKYGKDDTLYPKDILKRAVVDQRLHFDTGVAFERGLRSITEPLLFRNQTEIPQHHIDVIVDIYNFLETFLMDTIYMAGNQLTIADFSLISTVTSLVAYKDIDGTKFPKLTSWIKRMESLPYYQESNGNGANKLVAMVKSKSITIVP
ncbi:glutathione S-transferase 1 [Stomoxys calcitrans]|uniref:glutathione S-transferase 1 n=1 Tax=Stomoxys calcitrans TaxID=35570 RepID=UPI0027E33953|nr:glutathione S-transferase 1 [Stomoxys calcitrans]